MAWFESHLNGGGVIEPLKFKDYYTYTSIPSGTIQAGYVMRNLFGAGVAENWGHLALGNDPEIYYDTSNNTIVRGDRYVTNGYLPITNFDMIWREHINKATVPAYVRATGTNAYSISQSVLGDYIYLRTVDILDQNGNVILEANCTLADLGLINE